ncbi:MAG: hypothetical protein AAB501_03380 [Patescibacteria group bacterium]
MSANFIKLNKKGINGRNGMKGVVFLFLCFLLLDFSISAEAGKVGDIKKRIKTKVSVFLPQNRQAQMQSVKTGIFFSPMETVILGGPEQNSIIQNTKVEFTLDGWQVLPFEKTNRFDVWLIGYDTGWRAVSSKVTYNLPAGKKTYTLLARAKNAQGEYDNTAVIRSFLVNVSDNFGKVKISNINYRGSSNRSNYEKLSIVNRSSDLGVNITGWTLKTSRFSNLFQIPQASRIYNPRDLNATDDIILNKGNFADIYVGKRSPLSVNFQENSCDSYLTGAFEGYDSLSGGGRCNLPSPSDYNSYSISCRRYLNGISSCKEPKLEYYSFINEQSCRDFIIKNYNYQACVDRSKNQASFYLGRWKIYLGRNEEILDDLDDTLYLYDSRGLLVDTYGY